MAKIAAEWLEANKKASPQEKAAFARMICSDPSYWALVKPNSYVSGGDVVTPPEKPETEESEDRISNA